MDTNKVFAIEISNEAKEDVRLFEEKAENSLPAIRFSDRMLDHCDLLKQFPRLGTPTNLPRHYRLIFGNFKIFYIINEQKKTILILRFWRAEQESEPY